jgi:hypothetical protein
VSKLLNLLEERGLLVPDQEEDKQSLASTSLDTRGKVIKEILESERKYVQDIEVLQVGPSHPPSSSRWEMKGESKDRLLSASISNGWHITMWKAGFRWTNMWYLSTRNTSASWQKKA